MTVNEQLKRTMGNASHIKCTRKSGAQKIRDPTILTTKLSAVENCRALETRI